VRWFKVRYGVACGIAVPAGMREGELTSRLRENDLICLDIIFIKIND